jgi:uncharacterized RmlC-like cupin family protein
MAGDELLTHITPEQRVEGERTSGMVRQQAIATDAMWAGVAFTEPGMTSGCHHHGDHETTARQLPPLWPPAGRAARVV